MEARTLSKRSRRTNLSRWTVGCLLGTFGPWYDSDALAQLSPAVEAPKVVGPNIGLTPNPAPNPTPSGEPRPRVVPTRVKKASPVPEVKREPVERVEALQSSGSSSDYGPPPPPVASTSPAPLAENLPVVSSASAAASAAPNAPMVSATPQVSVAPPASVAPRALAPASKTYPMAEVKVRDVVVLRLKLADGGLIPAERAKRAKRAIEAALVESKIEAVRTEVHADRALLYIGNRPIVELTSADALSLDEGSLELYAASAAAKIRDLLENERRQSVVANTVLNVVLVGALAVGVVLALRLLSNLSRKLQRFIELNPEKIPSLHLRSIEVIRPHVLRSGFVVGVGVLKFILQFVLVYTWLVFASSLFDATKGLADRLSSLLLSPLASLMTRFAALLPLVLVTAIAVAVLFVLLRFVELFFAAVERRETELSWLRPELAASTSLLIRIGVIAASMLFLAPVVTGNLNGALSQLGLLFVVTAALSSTPLLANVAIGLVMLYGARLTEGDFVQLGSTGQSVVRGRVKSLGLLEMTLLSEAGHEVRVAHLMVLLRPLTVIGKGQKTRSQDLMVEAEAKPEQLVSVLNQLVKEQKLLANVRLLRLANQQSCVELRLQEANETRKEAVLIGVGRALSDAGLPLILAEWRDVT